MAKFNTATVRSARGNGPIAAEATPSTRTHEGAPGYLRDVKSELFLLAVANFVGEDTFYEKAGARDDRYAALVRDVAVSDVEWLTAFVRWLRTGGNMRSAPLVAAAEGGRPRTARRRPQRPQQGARCRSDGPRRRARRAARLCRSLILVDTSGSMSSGGFSKHSKMTPVKAAAVFGVALAAKGEAVDMYGFADGVFLHQVGKGASVIREVDRLCTRVGEVGHGTQIAGSIRTTYRQHDLVFVISDMQTVDHGVTRAVPATVPL